MKLRNLFLASVACAGLFTACSNSIDEAIDNGGKETNSGETAYASFAIQMPAGTGLTRAITEEVGKDQENKVTDITLLFFDAEKSNNLADIKVIGINKLNTDGVYTIQDLVVTKGKRNVYAFVNAQAKIKAFAPNDNGYAYSVITGIGEEDAASMSEDYKFTMSNARTVATTAVEFTDKGIANGNPIRIQVERTVAKVTYTGKEFDFVVNNAAGDPVGNAKLTDIKLVNMNDKYFYLRRVSNNADGSESVIGGVEDDGNNYVVDPNFTDRLPIPLDRIWKESAYKTIAENATFYCLENTMNKEAQYNGVTTGVMFQAKFTMTETKNSDGNIYRHNGMLYNNATAVKAAAGITDDTTGWTLEQWAAKNVTFYAKGICYYPYWIKHVDNNNATIMGTMEYGVVRNNVYKLEVSKISGIGAPEDKIDPENPDEVLSSFISVSVDVLKWTVRANGNIEL